MGEIAYYIDLALLFSIAFLLFSYNSSDEEFKILALMLLIINILFITKDITLEDKNRAIFNANSKLKCEVGEKIFYPNKEDNWSMESHYFIKDRQVIEIQNCMLSDEKVKL